MFLMLFMHTYLCM